VQKRLDHEKGNRFTEAMDEGPEIPEGIQDGFCETLHYILSFALPFHPWETLTCYVRATGTRLRIKLEHENSLAIRYPSSIPK
jgi:hypothetical protein